MKSYFLLDTVHSKPQKRMLRMCSTASQIYLFYGYRGLTEENVAKFWTYDNNPPSHLTINANISVRNVKWYLSNFLEIEDKVWNPDFINGLTRYGFVRKSRVFFPTFVWFNNSMIEKILSNSPFHCERLIAKSEIDISERCKWSSVPALCLNYSDKSISFMAGVLATGRLKVFDGMSYAKYNHRIGSILKSWNIPIEKEDRFFVYISPFWVLLFTPWMPECCKFWVEVKKPYRAKEYSLIMWRIFSGKDIKTDGLPYLVSRRTYYYKYGSIKNLEKKWVENKLVEMDLRVKEVVKLWIRKLV